MSRWRDALGGVADLVWPRACWLCDRRIPPTAPPGCLCDACLPQLLNDPTPTCPRCSSSVGPHSDLTSGCPSCRGTTFHFDGAVRLGPYDGLLKEAVLAMKQDAGEPLAEELGGHLAVARREKLLAHAPAVVMPIPLHWRRRWTRGYNQSEAIARGAAAQLQLPVHSWLVSRRHTSQRGLSGPERRENVRGAFRASRWAAVRGVRVLLIDDVLTTGATADAAATALRAAGAAQVSVAVVAHG